MNNYLWRIASRQVEAIDDVLAMVARDRRRVENLLQEVESIELRQYLSEWLNATATAPLLQETRRTAATTTQTISQRQVNINNSNNVAATAENPPLYDADDLVEVPLGEEEEEEELAKVSSSSSSLCKVWNDDSKSFWDIFPNNNNTSSSFPRDILPIIRARQRRRSRLAYGVSYEWATEVAICEGESRWTNGKWEWDDTDQYYSGRHLRRQGGGGGDLIDIDGFLENFYNRQHRQLGIGVPGDYYRIGILHQDGVRGGNREEQDDEEDWKRIFGGRQYTAATTSVLLPTVDQVTRSNSGADSIIYDMIFTAGDLSISFENGYALDSLLRYHRTSKGTLVLSVNGINSTKLVGKVEMDSSSTTTQLLDAIPFGGDFTFEETSRHERLQSNYDFFASRWNRSSASVIFVTGHIINSTTTSTTGAAAAAAAAAAPAKGEIKMIRQRTALFLTSSEKKTDDKSNIIINPPPSSSGDGFGEEEEELRFKANILEEASKRMEHYKQRRCMWMHRHTQLPEEVIDRIGSFVCPPPVLYLEEGDLVIDMDWGPTLQEIMFPQQPQQQQQQRASPTNKIVSLSTAIFRPRGRKTQN